MSAGDVALTAEVELCKRGHPLTPENIVRQADGRRCRTCKRDAARRRSRRASAMRTGKYTLTRADLLTVNADRFWTKVARSAPDECWEWTGARSRGGYGQCFVSTRRTNTSAHRVSWVLSGNDLDPSQDLDHLCRDRKSVV